jgi:uncharacterized protein (DUF1684 family)
MDEHSAATSIELLDYRRSVAALYARVRELNRDVAEQCRQFREGRDKLFRTHPQSALSDEQKAQFAGLRYYDYNASLRFVFPLDPAVEPTVLEVKLAADGLLRMQRVGKLHLQIDGQAVDLSLFWLLGYGGGLFLPFRDATSGSETYGGGRYLLDTIKHADLGQEGTRLVIDFNYAYNPSCAYNHRWECPLAPHENWLPVAIRAGEQRFETKAEHPN